MAQVTESQPSQTDLFEKFKSYPFTTDQEFANGLSIILRHPETPASEDEINREDDLVLQAKCFYFSRKEKLSPSLDLQAYKAWKASNTGDEQSSEDTRQQPGTSDEPAGTVPSGNTTGSGPRSNHSREPSYPSSFAHIVELITTGQPIPGIQQIPDTVLTGHDTSSEKPKRLKPWEKETANTVE